LIRLLEKRRRKRGTDMDKVIVPSEGEFGSPIMIIGEAPGEEEEAVGRPFVGSAGKMLDQLLHSADITRSECYITNVIKERPIDNEVWRFIKFNSRGQAITTPEYEMYKDQVMQEVRDCKPVVVVPLGNIPLWTFTGLGSITKWRGSILQRSMVVNDVELNGVEESSFRYKVVPTIHPAAALRQYIYKYFISYDLKRVKEESRSREYSPPYRNIIIGDRLGVIQQFLDRCMDCTQVAFDIEVVNEEVSCMSIAQSPQDILVVTLVSKGANVFDPDQEVEIWKEIARLLENQYVRKIGQNLAFDGTFLLRKYGIRLRSIEDTMVAMGILAPEFPKGLDFITSIYTREPYYKDDGKKYWRIGGSEEAFWRYNALDSAVCLDALPDLLNDVKKLGNDETYKKQRDLIEPLMYMQERGIRVDTAGMRAASLEAQTQIEELTEILQKMCGFEINPDSPDQLKNYFYIKKGAKAYVKRGTGNITTDEDALKRLARLGHEEASIVLKLRKLGKMKNTYFDMKTDTDGRLRCSFNPVGTKTGRLSSSKTIFGTGGNMQNLPPKMKQMLLADEGYLMYNIDLSQAENRIVAYIAPDISMINAFEGGIDIHKQTASLIFRKPVSDISDEPGSCDIGGGVYSERFWGKKANHGLNYGLGYRTFSFLYEIDEKDAKFIVDRYHEAYPGVRQYHAWVKNSISQNRRLTNCYGRVRIFFDRWGEELFKEAYAQIPQSSVADKINRDGLIPIYRKDWEVELLNQVHDSIVLQIPISIGIHRHFEILSEIKGWLEEPLQWGQFKFSIPAEIKGGYNLYDMKKIETEQDISNLIQNKLEAKNDPNTEGLD
jgi:uracil-DNA glycosylase family 4